MRKFVANFTRLRSEAEERWNRAQPVLWVVPFYFRHKNSSRRRFAANYFPLSKEGGREEGITGWSTRDVRECNSRAVYTCSIRMNIFRADNYDSELTFHNFH